MIIGKILKFQYFWVFFLLINCMGQLFIISSYICFIEFVMKVITSLGNSDVQYTEKLSTLLSYLKLVDAF